MAQLILILLVVFAILVPSKTKEFVSESIDQVQKVYKVAVKVLDNVDKLDKE